EGGGGRGEGIGLGEIGTLGHGSGSGGDDPSSLLSIGNLAGITPSEGVESGALFRYTLGEKLDLRAHGSALVPFLGEGVEARRVALFTEPTSSARSAVYVTHHGERTLPEGTLAVFGDGGFAGESALPRLKPTETTTVEYGADLDITLAESPGEERDEPRALRFRNWELVEHYARHHEPTFHLENKSGEKRDVFVGLEYVNNAAVLGADELVYDSRHGRAFAVFALGARASADRELHVTEGLSRLRSVLKLTSTELATLAHAVSLPEKERALAGEAANWLARAEAKRRSLRATNAELEVREAEVERYREHARALGAARGTEDVVARLLAAEDRAEALRRSARMLAADAEELGRKATRSLVKLGE
ncbi:MAG TPA: hypothetical protein VGQ57_07225, partial [Polyangiaceae bacterium]|nr:hypothetical protein [Polyangiaceae bacterium]